MNLIRAAAAVALIVSLSLAGDAQAWKGRFMDGDQKPVDGNCPDNNRSVSWRDYISGRVPPKGDGVGNPYGIQFRLAKKVADPAAIGGLATKVCYTGGYVVRPAGDYPTQGFFSIRWGASKAKKGLPGDPLKYQINVDGVLLMFTEGGMILDRRGRAVGILVCYPSDECANY